MVVVAVVAVAAVAAAAAVVQKTGYGFNHRADCLTLPCPAEQGTRYRGRGRGRRRGKLLLSPRCAFILTASAGGRVGGCSLLRRRATACFQARGHDQRQLASDVKTPQGDVPPFSCSQNCSQNASGWDLSRLARASTVCRTALYELLHNLSSTWQAHGK